ncbi:UNVERIFIED_CONTAM: Flavonoid 3',5'-hydroxylase [Sesamum angustifolium]|uniref:Flavonoid 3',5'-hydroxylase n=1 Tax=Sesamum angustifolium TaxID=2727405 RepID=A0AAW2K9Q3_9LAMI
MYGYIETPHSKIKKKRLPPGPTGLPILGSLPKIGERPHESLAKLAKTYGPLMTVKFGMLNVVVASSADMAKKSFIRTIRPSSAGPLPNRGRGKVQGYVIGVVIGPKPALGKKFGNLQHSAFHKSKNGLTARIEASSLKNDCTSQ